MEASLIPQSNHGIMDEEEEEDEVGSSLSSFTNDSADSTTSSSEFMEDATSPSTESQSPPSSDDNLAQGSSLYEMSCLMAQLPFKRGLSKHYQGKSQSFTSLSNVRSLEDLAKPERPWKKMKPCKSYGGVLDSQKSLTPKACSRTITKKPSKGSLYSIMAKRSSFLGSKPPVHLHRPSNISAQTLLFA